MRRWTILWLALVIVAMDRILKIWVARTMVVGQSITVIPHVLWITYILNSGAAFSLLPHSTFLFVGVAFLLLGAVGYAAWKVKDLSPRAIWGLGLLAGGSAGNLWDRLISGRVIDYIHVRFSAVFFNLADSAIVVGILLLVWDYGRRQGREDDANTSRNSGGSAKG